MAKRPCYPGDITRRYDELPEDHPRRTTDEKLEAAFILEKHWDDQTSFKDLAERDEVSVSSYTISRTWRDFFGPTDEDYTFYELGKKYKKRDEDVDTALNEYLAARKNDRLDEFRAARSLSKSEDNEKTVVVPQTARELEIAQWYYQRGVEAVKQGEVVDEDVLDLDLR